MSDSNGHLSASERKIRALEQRLAELEMMRAEFTLLLNHLVSTSEAKSYRLYKAQLIAMGPPRTVKGVKAMDPDLGDFIEWTLIDPPTPGIIIPESRG